MLHSVNILNIKYLIFWSASVVLTVAIALIVPCLQCFDAVGWAAERASGLQKTEWWGAGVVMCLGQGADLHMALLMPLPLTIFCSSKFRLVFGFIFLVPAHLGSPGQNRASHETIVVV